MPVTNGLKQNTTLKMSKMIIIAESEVVSDYCTAGGKGAIRLPPFPQVLEESLV